MADEILGREVDLARIQEREHPRAHVGIIDPFARETERRGAARARVDDRGHAGLDADAIGMQAEVAQPWVHMHVKVDEARRDEQSGRVNDPGAGGRLEICANGLDAAVASQHVGDFVAARGRIDHPAPPEHETACAYGVVHHGLDDTPWMRALIAR